MSVPECSPGKTEQFKFRGSGVPPRGSRNTSQLTPPHSQGFSTLERRGPGRKGQEPICAALHSLLFTALTSIMQSCSVLQPDPSRAPARARPGSPDFCPGPLRPPCRWQLGEDRQTPACREHFALPCFLSIQENLPWGWICP